MLNIARTGLALTILLSPAMVAAQTYPNKPIRIVALGPAGGGTDVAARFIGQKLTEQWGQPVVVENRGGAGGTIGMEIVARSAPDGYSLVLIYGSFFIAPAVYSKLRFDPVKDFSPVIQLFNAPLMIAANPAVPALPWARPLQILSIHAIGKRTVAQVVIRGLDRFAPQVRQ
jgi:tripartite-type tricarboxylate transporter receptor subunit TctC